MNNKKLLENYQKQCPVCGKRKLTPKNRTKCLNCLQENTNLQLFNSNTFCLECGKEIFADKDDMPFCKKCLKEMQRKLEEHIKTALPPDYVFLFEQFIAFKDEPSKRIFV